MILYQSALSTYSLKVRLALAVKGASVELREPPGGSYRSGLYRAIVPPATVPALVDGAFILTESDAIVEYFDERFDGPRLLPAEAQARARTRMLSRIADMRLEASIRSLFPRVKAGDLLGPADLAPAEQAWRLLCDMADPVGPWACGPEASLADFGVAASMVWLDLFRDPDKIRATPRAALWRAAWRDDLRLAPLLASYRELAGSWMAGLVPPP